MSCLGGLLVLTCAQLTSVAAHRWLVPAITAPAPRAPSPPAQAAQPGGLDVGEHPQQGRPLAAQWAPHGPARCAPTVLVGCIVPAHALVSLGQPTATTPANLMSIPDLPSAGKRIFLIGGFYDSGKETKYYNDGKCLQPSGPLTMHSWKSPHLFAWPALPGLLCHTR